MNHKQITGARKKQKTGYVFDHVQKSRDIGSENSQSIGAKPVHFRAALLQPILVIGLNLLFSLVVSLQNG